MASPYPIPPKMRADMASEIYYRSCAREGLLGDHHCRPDPATGQLIQWEHAFKVRGRRLNRKWAIIPSCWWAHQGPGLDKRINEWIALNRATEAELDEFPRSGFRQRKKYLNGLFGTPQMERLEPPF